MEANSSGVLDLELTRLRMLIESALDEFRESLTFSSADMPAMHAALNMLRGRPELASALAQALLETQLAQAISSRQFAGHTAALFFVSSQAFSWEPNGGRFAGLGAAGHQIQVLLKELAFVDEETRRLWLDMTCEPTPRAVSLLKLDVDPREAMPPMVAFIFYPEGHIRAWLDMREKHFANLRWPSALWKRKDLRRMVWVLVIVPFVFAAWIRPWWADFKGREARGQRAACDAMYASAIATGWMGLAVDELERMKLCAAHLPPLLCEDRDALDAAIGRATRLLGREVPWTPFVPRGLVRIDMPDGRGFSVDDTANCGDLWYFAGSTRWLDQADAKGAREFIGQLARCPTSENPSPALRHLLTYTDAWPGPKGKMLLAVGQLLDQAKNSTVAVSVSHVLSSTCETTLEPALEARMGSKEFAAASARASHSR